MNSAVNELVQAITGKNTLGECSVIELQQITNQYPYFGPAQFLLAQKLKEEGSSEHAAQLQKASFYFSNPLWLHFLINSPGNDEIIAEFSPKTFDTGSQEKPGAPDIEQQADVSPQEELSNEAPTETSQEEDAASSFNSSVPEEPVEKQMEYEAGILMGSEEKNTEVPENIAAPSEEQFVQVESTTSEKITGSLTEPETEPTNEQQPVFSSDKEEFSQLQEDQPGQEATHTFAGMTSLKIEPIKDSDKVLTFEPYHTVDYFASQGIRFREEEKPKDKFGQQLKSFTEWLKALKRLPDAEVSVPPAVATDQKIEQMAEKSLADENVITEAMAEVWEKQGNPGKAIEIYNKLSLSDPAKSSYFVAKIEQLKHS